MLNTVDLKFALEDLDLIDKPVIAHASLRSFGYIKSGVDAVLRAMLSSFKSVMMPAFTYKTMVTPEVGPPNNGITYGSEKDLNKMAQSFKLNMRVDPMIGILAETLQVRPFATRTNHPILSFTGIRADEFLITQTIAEPLAPIGALAKADGWVVLINVDHSVNTSIHYAEKLAGRKQFVRWAINGNRIVECPGFPGDSSGFNAIAEHLKADTRRVEVGHGFIQAVPLKRIIDVTQDLIKKDPLALLCQRSDCERCNAVRGI
ncbi:MAG: AAC(3) family N-acetyltransferase [Chloroflexota bacterium]